MRLIMSFRIVLKVFKWGCVAAQVNAVAQHLDRPAKASTSQWRSRL